MEDSNNDLFRSMFCINNIIFSINYESFCQSKHSNMLTILVVSRELSHDETLNE